MTSAYIRSPAGLNSLLPIPPGSVSSQAMGINACGKVVGQITTPTHSMHAALWNTGC